MKGKFISFEGGDGGGKSTQIKMLADHLEKQGIKVILTREPGGSHGAEILRELVLTGDVSSWSHLTEALLFAAARSDHLEKRIRPALEAGAWVLCDRFLDSTRAYQGIAGKVPNELIQVIEKYVVAETMPDRTYILDLDPKVGLSRTSKRFDVDEAEKDAPLEDRFENMAFQFHVDLRACYLDIAKNEPNRCVIINAEQSVEDIFADIRSNVQDMVDAS